MSLADDLYSALQGIVGGRCYPEAFPLTIPVPAWPAIRYSIVSEVPAITICGDSGEEANDTRIQIDAVAPNYADVAGIASDIMSALSSFSPPAIRENSVRQWDAETKTFRITMDYIFYASSGA